MARSDSPAGMPTAPENAGVLAYELPTGREPSDKLEPGAATLDLTG